MTTLFYLIIFVFCLASTDGYRLGRYPTTHRRSTTGSLRNSNLRPPIKPFNKFCTQLFSSNDDSLDGLNSLKATLKGTCVYFVGMMGSGKSTVGEQFAKKIGYRFLDTDEIAEFMIEMPIADFFRQGNETEFRELEYQILMEMSQYTRVVLSTGGGIVMKNDNWGLLRHGVVVFLDIEPEDIVQRFKGNADQLAKRPLLRGEDPLNKLKEIYGARIEKYEQADVRVKVTSDLTPEQVTDKVVQGLLDFIKTNPPQWKTWKTMKELKESQDGSRKPEAGKGSVQYVSLSDIQSGKVKLPNGNSASTMIEGLPKEN